MKEIIGGIAVFLTFAAYVPYYRDIIKGKTHPHVYSWSLWGLLTVLLVALQIKGGAGAATWVTAAAGLLCIGVIVLSLKRGKKDITTSDTIVAILALMAIGFWLVANQPVMSIILVIVADALAFIPTTTAVERVITCVYRSQSLKRQLSNSLRVCGLMKPIWMLLKKRYSESGRSATHSI